MFILVKNMKQFLDAMHFYISLYHAQHPESHVGMIHVSAGLLYEVSIKNCAGCLHQP